jgi:hypothetical protein
MMPTATAAVSVEDAINRRRGDLIELSHSIHAEPELAFAEFKRPAGWTRPSAPSSAAARW